jgi:hypothetical protein
MHAMPEPTTPIRPRRRWFRFSLRTLLALVIVVAIPLAWIAKERRQSFYEQQLAEQLREGKHAIAVRLGGALDRWEPRTHHKPQGWWRDLAHKVLGERVLEVSCHAGDLEDLTPLTGFANLQGLYCGGMDLDYMDGEIHFQRDLTPLVQLTNLRWLGLSRCEIRDLAPIAGLPNLKELLLDGTDVTEEQVAALQKALPNCEINVRSTRPTEPRLELRVR